MIFIYNHSKLHTTLDINSIYNASSDDLDQHNNEIIINNKSYSLKLAITSIIEG